MAVDTDPATITSNDTYGYVQQIAKDKNHIYCGNKIVPDLNLKTLRLVLPAILVKICINVIVIQQH